MSNLKFSTETDWTEFMDILSKLTGRLLRLWPNKTAAQAALARVGTCPALPAPRSCLLCDVPAGHGPTSGPAQLLCPAGLPHRRLRWSQPSPGGQDWSCVLVLVCLAVVHPGPPLCHSQHRPRGHRGKTSASGWTGLGFNPRPGHT